jgi:hypothetical protein
VHGFSFPSGQGAPDLPVLFTSAHDERSQISGFGYAASSPTTHAIGGRDVVRQGGVTVTAVFARC